MFQKITLGYPRFSKLAGGYISLHAIKKDLLQIHKHACSYISLCMQLCYPRFPKLAGSYISLHAVKKDLLQIHKHACSYINLCMQLRKLVCSYITRHPCILPTTPVLFHELFQWIIIGLIHRKSQKKAVKSNLGKFLRKCKFNFFNAKN